MSTEPVSFKVVRVTPAMAKDWLSKNTFNRAPQHKIVERYASDMIIGDWRLTGDTIKFASTGELIDGQHRLLAIIRSRLAQKMLVVNGLDKEVFYMLDIGKKRSFHDVLAINDYTNTALTAATIRTCYIWTKTKFKSFKSDAPSSHNYDVLMDFITKNPSIKKSIHNQISLGRNYLIPDSILAAMHWILKKIDAEKADDFIFKMTTGLELINSSPIYIARKKVEQLRRQGNSLRKQEYINVIIQTWNAYYNRKPLTQIILKTGPDVTKLVTS